MAQPTFTPFTEGMACSHTLMNAAFASTVAQSALVDGTNIRQEGLDRNSIVDGVANVYHLTDGITGGTAISYGTAGGPTIDCTNWVNIQSGADVLRIDNGGLGFTIDGSRQYAKVRASVEVRRMRDLGGTAAAIVLGFKMFYRISGAGVTIDIPETRRQCAVNYYTVGNRNQQVGRITISHILYVDGTFDYIDLRVKAEGDTMTNANEWAYLSECFMDLQVLRH